MILPDGREIHEEMDENIYYTNRKSLHFKKGVKLDYLSEIFCSKTFRSGYEYYTKTSKPFNVEDYICPLGESRYFEPINFRFIPNYVGCKFLPSLDGEPLFYYPSDLDKFILRVKKEGRNFKVLHEGGVDILKWFADVNIHDCKISKDILEKLND